MCASVGGATRGHRLGFGKPPPGRTYPLAVCGVAPLCCSPPALLETEPLTGGVGTWAQIRQAAVDAAAAGAPRGAVQRAASARAAADAAIVVGALLLWAGCHGGAGRRCGGAGARRAPGNQSPGQPSHHRCVSWPWHVNQPAPNHRLPAAPVESSRASPPHRPREDGLAHPADTSRCNSCCCLRPAFEVAAFQTPFSVLGCGAPCSGPPLTLALERARD
jgi:hypothetical protein